MISSHITPPPLPQLSWYTRRVHILPATNDRCLIYVGKLYEDGFAVNFDINNVFLQKSKDVLIGYRDATTDLYSINFDNPQPLPSVANNYYLALSTPSPRPSTIYAYSVNKMTKKSNLLLYLHQAAWIPVPPNYIQAIYASLYATHPGLTESLIHKHPPKSIYMARGHLRQ